VIGSPAVSLASLPPAERAAILADLSDDEVAQLEYDWQFWARPNQLAPGGDWRTWLLLAGRGFGKTRTGAEWVRSIKDRCSRIALVAPTAADVRDVVVEGESGLLAISPRWDRPTYEPSKRRLTWPNGAMATCYSADEPERLRGPQHAAAWCDELAAWRYPEAWDMLMFGLRLGDDPRCVVTTTPRPVKMIRDLLQAPTTHVTRGSTYDNRTNLAQAFFDQIVTKYEGTRLGRQELNAELLDDVPGALWNRAALDAARVVAPPLALKRIVVAIDPATTSTAAADETGIVVVGVGADGRGYVLEDVSCRETPQGWASIAVAAFSRWRADRIIGEANQGGDMVESTIRTVASNIPYKAVHASRGKVIRAEPVAALYEQGRISHVGSLATLEDQMCGFTIDFDRRIAGYSPDRLDALVWGVTEVMVDLQAKPARTATIPHMAR
jgi:phage terminase large subunit-like protein